MLGVRGRAPVIRSGRFCGHPRATGLRHMGVGKKMRSAARGLRLCVNCGASLPGAGAGDGASATAWHWHCPACSELVTGQMDLVVDQPDGAFARIYRCQACWTPRVLPPGWVITDPSKGELRAVAA